ncbi:hypothetical protein CBR_g20109 [Chara braunii]|uniref:GTPase Der n=1 Tax=Chara braunii TaxID=69332 RepID=A0A388KZN6_CHABU|nr:hypothetical protein CBR_g20109 [Chara braunii]|eukprot:GBG75478.1 hypothetical protein CBR_g20109 [Chara braunii]
MLTSTCQLALARGVPPDTAATLSGSIVADSWRESGGAVCLCPHGRKAGSHVPWWLVASARLRLRLSRSHTGLYSSSSTGPFGRTKSLLWPSAKVGPVPNGPTLEKKRESSPLCCCTRCGDFEGPTRFQRCLYKTRCKSFDIDSQSRSRPLLPCRQVRASCSHQDDKVGSSLEMSDVEDEDEGDYDGVVLSSVDELDLEAQFTVEQHKRDLLRSFEEDDKEQIDDTRRRGRKGDRKGRSQQHRDEGGGGMQIPERLLPRVAIVGRPNVGKSALFNRIVGGNQAIVHNEPGVTRDRLYRRAFWGSHEFLVVDTGGIINTDVAEEGVAVGIKGGNDTLVAAVRDASRSGLPSMIEKHVAIAVEEAAAVIMVVDGQAGLIGSDIEIASWLRRKHPGKHVTLGVNKCESPTKGLLQCTEFWSLGWTPFPVSAITGSGTGDFLDDLCSGLVKQEILEGADAGQDSEDEDRPLGIAIVGRPNVGKSSIMNAILGEERTIVSAMSGTTRDAIDMEFTSTDGKSYRLIDTAGIRRRAAVATAKSRAEALSIQRAFRAVRRADVVALIIDAKEGVTEQDGRLANRIEQEGKACVIVMNKWDTVPDKNSNTINRYTDAVRLHLSQLDWAPIVYTSATSNQRIPRILEAADQVGAERCKRLTTATLNAITQEAYAFKQPPTMAGKKGRIYYCTQAAIRPPTFVFFVNDSQLFPDAYRKYMEKQLRANVGYHGTPIRLLWRSKRRDPDRIAARSRAAARS